MNTYTTSSKLQRAFLSHQITNLQEQVERARRHIQFVDAMGGPASVASYFPNGESPVQHPKYGKTSQSFILYFFYSEELPHIELALQQKLDEEQAFIKSK